MRRVHTLVLATAAIGVAYSAGAQTPILPPQQQSPNMPAPQSTIPEKVAPQDPSSTGSTGTLSDKLERSDGVIRPPTGIDPDITARAPDPDPGTTRVIPPPGTPGGDPTLDPK
jgi:hypothetical protein